MGKADLIDLGAIVLVLIAAAHGWHSRGTSIAGRWVGLVLGLAVAVAVDTRVVTSASWLLTAGILLVGLLLGVAVGGWIGDRIARLLQRLGIGGVDRVAGVLVSGVLALVAASLLLSVLAHGTGQWAQAARASSAIQVADRLHGDPSRVTGPVAGAGLDGLQALGLDKLPALLGRPAGI